MSTDRGMDTEFVVYNGILRSHEKNDQMPSAATWMDLEIVILNEVKDKYHMVLLICAIC